jgi:ATP-dependent Clp protease ATP-binding subunit ClpA
MEYYRGLLFLTTNRIASIDDAFLSRVHIVIGYEPLTDDDREKIWNNFFDKLKRERKDKISVSMRARNYVKESDKLKTLEWNGREIRNGMSSFLWRWVLELTQNASMPNCRSASRVRSSTKEPRIYRN